MLIAKIPKLKPFVIPTIQGCDLEDVKSLVLPKCPVREKTEYLFAHPELGNKPVVCLHDETYGSVKIMSNCRGTASWILGWDKKIKEIWLRAHPENIEIEDRGIEGVWLREDENGPGYIGRKALDLFLATIGQTNSKTPVCLIEINYPSIEWDTKLDDPVHCERRHSLVWLGSAFSRRLVFHQRGEGGVFEYALWDEYREELNAKIGYTSRINKSFWQ